MTGRVPDQELKGVLGGVGSAPRRSRALARMASFAAGADDYRRALRLVELALSEAGDDGPARAEALAVGAAVDMNLGQLESAGHLADEALTLFDRLGDRHGRAMVLDLEAMRTFLAGHVAAGVAAERGPAREAARELQGICKAHHLPSGGTLKGADEGIRTTEGGHRSHGCS